MVKSKKLLYFAYSSISDYITFDNYYYLPSLCKAKWCNIKRKIMNFRKVCIKNRTCYYFHDIIKLEDFDLDNTSVRYHISQKSGITYFFSLFYKNHS